MKILMRKISRLPYVVCVLKIKLFIVKNGCHNTPVDKHMNVVMDTTKKMILLEWSRRINF